MAVSLMSLSMIAIAFMRVFTSYGSLEKVLACKFGVSGMDLMRVHMVSSSILL